MHTAKKVHHRHAPAPAFHTAPPSLQTGDTHSPAPAAPPSPTPPLSGAGGPPNSSAASSPTGGPRTPEGKAVASRNATTHGLFSRQAVLPHLGEDAEGYRQVLNALTEQFDPRTLMERQYLELWAEASWKLRRLGRWEAQLWEQDGVDEDARLLKLERVMRLQTTLRRQLDKAVRMLSQDVPDVQKHYARRAVLASRCLTETDCRHDPRIAYDVESAVQTEILCAPGLTDLDRSSLDAAPASQSAAPITTPQAPIPEPEMPPVAPDADENCQNELSTLRDSENCQNEPTPCEAESPTVTSLSPVDALARPDGPTGERCRYAVMPAGHMRADRGPSVADEAGVGDETF